MITSAITPTQKISIGLIALVLLVGAACEYRRSLARMVGHILRGRHSKERQ